MTPGARPFGMDDRFRLRRAGGVLVLAALVASAGVPLLLGGRAAFSAILHFPAHGYAALCMAIVASWLARALKLRLLMRRLDAPAGFMRALAISLAMDFAFMVTPGGIGVPCLRRLLDSIDFVPQSDGMLLKMTRRLDRSSDALA